MKYILYDWFGFNKVASQYLHSALQSSFVIKFLHFISDYFASYYFFDKHLVMLIIALACVIHYKNSKLHHTKSAHTVTTDLIVKYIHHVIVFCLCAVIGYWIMHLVKYLFGLARPYCAHDFILNQQVAQFSIYLEKNCAFTFPSGHAAYIWFLVLSFWEIMHKYLKVVGVLLIILTGISRVALGMHYISDILYAFLLSHIVYLITCKIVNYYAQLLTHNRTVNSFEK